MSLTLNGSGSIDGLSPGGLTDQTVTPSELTQPLTLMTAKSATGTSVDFDSIPAWVKRVTVMLNGLSISGVSPSTGTTLVRFRLGDSTIATSGYSGAGSIIAAAGAVSVAQTAGFDIYHNSPAAANAFTGGITFTNITGNVWVASGVFSLATAATFTVAGSLSLTTALTQVRITTSNGTDTFDAGTINVMYEG